MDPVQQLLSQSPTHVTADKAKECLERANGDITQALLELWNVHTVPSPTQGEWEERRNLANMMSEEVSKLLKASKSLDSINTKE